MANTIDADLINKMVLGSAMKASAQYAPVMDLFTTRFSDAAVSAKPKCAVVLQVPTVAAATQTDASSFETGDTTYVDLTTTLLRKTKNIQFSADEINRGLTVQGGFDMALESLNKDIVDAVLTAFLSGTEGSDVLASVDDLVVNLPEKGTQSFCWLNKAGLKKVIPSKTDGTRIDFSDGVSGFDKAVVGSLGAEDANLLGICGVKESVVIASALPIVSGVKEGYLVQDPQTVVLQCGLPVSVWAHWSPSSNSYWYHIDVYLGAALLTDDNKVNFKLTAS